MTHGDDALRIGYLVPQFPGQTHIFFWREIKALEEMGHEVQIYSTRKPPAGIISHDWSGQAMARTVYLGRIDAVKAARALLSLLPKGFARWIVQEGRSFAKDALITLSAAEMLRRDCAAKGIDHVHVHSCGRAALVAAFCHLMGGPTYSLTLHGAMHGYGAGQRFKWRNAAFATVVTRTLKAEVEAELAGHLPPRVAVQAMGVDTVMLRRDTPYEPVTRGRPMQLFSCGRLNMAKGHQDLMTTVRKLIDAGVDVRLEIAGEDDMGGGGFRKELESHLKTLRLQDHVKLLGAVDAGEVKRKLLAAHVFVLASWEEALGVVYMEAMSCGVPVIGTNVGGVPELVTEGRTGLLVPPRDPEAMANAIRRLAGDPGLASTLSRNGRTHVVDHFSAEFGAKTLVTEIRTALAG